MNERSFITTYIRSLNKFSELHIRRGECSRWGAHTLDPSVVRAEKSLDSLMPKQYNARETESVGRKKILALARNLFWQNGYNTVSMRDLARAYGCQPANLYNYFKTKEAILFEVLQEEMEQIIRPIRHLEEAEDGDPVEQLRLIISSHLEVTLSHRRSAKLLFDVALDSLPFADRKVIVSMRDTYDRIIRKVIRRGQEKGIFLPHNEKLVGFMIASMITRTRIWFHPQKGVTAGELADFIFQFALRGILTRDEIEAALGGSGLSSPFGSGRAHEKNRGVIKIRRRSAGGCTRRNEL
ncbi:MAG TPA: TetR/AcrR family transcriptional regulator [Desulfomonilaceae bacterium]|nr:TetR/AcrR family transcriptional regulator [Desulfomonilaceae bacterium]